MTAPLNQLDWWRRPKAVPDDPPLLRDPARLLLLLAAVCLIVGNLIPWAVGLDPAGRPAAYRSTQGTAEGVPLIAFGILFLLLARDRTMWESTSRSLQLLPVLAGLISVVMWLGADFYSNLMIEDWIRGGGSGAQTNARLIVAVGIVATGMSVVWLEWHRPASIKARTRPIWIEWGFTRWSAASVVAAFTLGAAGTFLALFAGLSFLAAEAMIIAVILAVFGLFIGIGLGLMLVRWLESAVRRRGAVSASSEGAAERASRRSR
ncbi:hypothetical protein BH24CHL6_BH24CHL6_04240 [soil metagenome]